MKLLALDLDGTTLNNREVISKKNMEAIQYAIDQGVMIVPVTGRCLDCIPKQLQNTDYFQYVITSNGAKVSEYPSRKVLYEDLMDYREILSFLEDCPSLWFTGNIDNQYILSGFFMNTLGRLIRGKDNKHIQSVSDLKAYIETSKKDIECLQMFMFPKVYKKVIELLKKYEGLDQVNTNAPNNIYMELYSSTTSKGKALQFLMNQLQIQKEDVYCIGDGENDISMFEAVATSIAVKNAASSLKEKATQIVPSNNEDGVAYAIYNIVTK